MEIMKIIYIELPFSSSIIKEKHIPVKSFHQKIFKKFSKFTIFEKIIFQKQKHLTKIMYRNNGKNYIALPFSSVISKQKHISVNNFPSTNFMNIFSRNNFSKTKIYEQNYESK